MSRAVRLSQESPIKRVLILGGSSEASALVRALAGRDDVTAILSLAGRTTNLPAPPVPLRVGGFGGVDGLAAYLHGETIDLVIDATHPFATQISQHARAASARAEVSLLRVTRPPWVRQQDDDWHEVASMAEAAAAIGATPRRVLLTIGSLQLSAFTAAPQHHYVVRTIDPVGDRHGLVDATFIEARGPFVLADEERLMTDHRVDILVTKNSGGEAAAAKLVAARNLGLPVILCRRPDQEAGTHSIEEALATIDAHDASARRGV